MMCKNIIVMERAVKYGVDIQLNKMKLKNEESFGAEVEKLQNKLTDIEANLASQETLLEKRNQGNILYLTLYRIVV